MSCGTEKVKIEPMDVYLGNDQAQSQKVTCVESTAAASLNDKYFALYKPDGSKFLVQFDVNNTGTPIVMSGYTVITVDIGANPQTAEQVATALQTAIDAHADFVATVSGKEVTITNVANGFAIPAHDAQATLSKTGFAFEVLVVGDLFEKVGLIDGDIEISNLGKAVVDVTAHQFGQTVLSQIEVSGSNPEISFALKETSMDKYEKLLRYSLGAFQPIAAGSTKVIGAGSSGLFKAPQLAKLVLHPVRLGVADKSADWCFWKTKIGLDSATFSGENILTIPVVANAFMDCSKPAAVSIFTQGDWSQNL